MNELKNKATALPGRSGEDRMWSEPTNATPGRSLGLWRVVPLVAIVMLGIIGMGSRPASAAAPRQPFVASTAGTLVFTPPTGTLTGVGVVNGFGPVTYLGNVTITGTGPNGEILDTLVETFTTANGDTLTLLCNQVAVEVAPGVLVGSDSWSVIGGTGQFAGATGSGKGTTRVDLNAGTFAKQSKGTITLR